VAACHPAYIVKALPIRLCSWNNFCEFDEFQAGFAEFNPNVGMLKYTHGPDSHFIPRVTHESYASYFCCKPFDAGAWRGLQQQ
jgi:hypothetical protein